MLCTWVQSTKSGIYVLICVVYNKLECVNTLEFLHPPLVYNTHKQEGNKDKKGMSDQPKLMDLTVNNRCD